ncbi:6028_t:CDS:2 [Acaulospora morrowiae]|uniref:6028_t:CDS:1 n=1 Tax=Acaulospora morrowiae TaxID=94023 RepID=A0A9N8YXM5_9GLOM|nr:6028_t:CDS:2 [Acaulospora morrowiae]
MKNPSYRYPRTSSLHRTILCLICLLTIVGHAQGFRILKKSHYIVKKSSAYSGITIRDDNGPTVNQAAIPFPHVFEEIYPEDYLDFLVLGDWGYQAKGVGEKKGDQVHVASAMENMTQEYGTQFIINVGDSFYKSHRDDYQGVNSVDDNKWKTVWSDVYHGRLAEIPWYSVAGNHDWYNNVTAEVDYFWTKNHRFFLPALFYVRHSYFGPQRIKVTWIHIDTNIFYYDYGYLDDRNSLKSNFRAFEMDKPGMITDRLKWIEEKLEENQDSKWIFVVGHHPLIGSCASKHLMSRLPLLFKIYGVTAYFSGHSHTLEYQSSKLSSPTTYFTSGSGSRFGSGCDGKDWGVPSGTLGFLHVRINGNSSKLDFQYVNATTYESEILHQGTVDAIPFIYPKEY